MYRGLGELPPEIPGYVYVGEDSANFYYQQTGVAGLWGAIKSVAKKVGGVASKVGGVAVSLIPGGGLIKTGLSAALDIIRRGTESQVAQAMAQAMSPEQRAEMERAYMERRARELAGAAKANALPLAVAAALVVALLVGGRRRR